MWEKGPGGSACERAPPGVLDDGRGGRGPGWLIEHQAGPEVKERTLTQLLGLSTGGLMGNRLALPSTTSFNKKVS